uniref:lipid phosphate phosphatase epsilon 1, chloroplastic-like n=1 Tax=Erigeron canadensis TaxID=72917 RepID=UPI001CB93B35|nr:lipid phosphate phosphatase epsilon 1, chloroplastic-like [Erigeron canadensis]
MGSDIGTISFDRCTTDMYYWLVQLTIKLSKWITAVTFGGLILLRHDGLALWAATGSVTNFLLSVILKRILKQERPVSQVSSGPGMPSSHAQSIFFSLVFVILSVIELMGSSGVTTILGVLIVTIGSYFAWLRVFLNYHTTKQVVVGTIVGSIFSVLWFWAWDIIVHEAYNTYMWVQVFLFVGVACYYLGFISYLFLHLTKDESY